MKTRLCPRNPVQIHLRTYTPAFAHDLEATSFLVSSFFVSLTHCGKNKRLSSILNPRPRVLNFNIASTFGLVKVNYSGSVYSIS